MIRPWLLCPDFFHFVNHPVIEWQLLSPLSKKIGDGKQQNTALVCTAVYIQCNKVKLTTYFWSAELHVLCRVVVLAGWAVASIVTPFLSACCIPSHLTASETQTEFTWTCYHDFSHVDCPWSWQHHHLLEYVHELPADIPHCMNCLWGAQ